MRIRWRVAAAMASVAAVAILAGCEYAYNDGLPPLGERSSSSATPTPAPRFTRQRFVPPSPFASDPPPEQWTPSMLSSWADSTLPDVSGLTFSFGYGVATPNEPVLATAFVPAGTLVLEYACRGAASAHLTLTVSGTAIVDSDYTCGRIGVRTIVVPEDSVAEVRASSVNDPSAYAFRIVRR